MLRAHILISMCIGLVFLGCDDADSDTGDTDGSTESGGETNTVDMRTGEQSNVDITELDGAECRALGFTWVMDGAYCGAEGPCEDRHFCAETCERDTDCRDPGRPSCAAIGLFEGGDWECNDTMMACIDEAGSYDNYRPCEI